MGATSDPIPKGKHLEEPKYVAHSLPTLSICSTFNPCPSVYSSSDMYMLYSLLMDAS